LELPIDILPKLPDLLTEHRILSEGLLLESLLSLTRTLTPGNTLER
jgi:hypothetical protein